MTLYSTAYAVLFVCSSCCIPSFAEARKREKNQCCIRAIIHLLGSRPILLCLRMRLVLSFPCRFSHVFLCACAGTIGPDVFPVVVGQYMEDFPELLVLHIWQKIHRTQKNTWYVQFFSPQIYLNLAVIVSCILLFAAAFALSRAVAGPSRGGGVSPTTKH